MLERLDKPGGRNTFDSGFDGLEVGNDQVNYRPFDPRVLGRPLGPSAEDGGHASSSPEPGGFDLFPKELLLIGSQVLRARVQAVGFHLHNTPGRENFDDLTLNQGGVVVLRVDLHRVAGK